MPLSSAEGYDPAASGRPQDDEKTLWEQGLPPSRETNLGIEMEHKNRARAPIMASAVMLKITYHPQPPPAGRAPSPIASTLTGAFIAAFCTSGGGGEVSVSGPALHLPSLGLSFDPQLPRCRGGLLPSQSEADAGGPNLMPAGCWAEIQQPTPLV